MAVANSSTSRFGKADENDILQSKDSKNTKNATKVALQTLTAYIIEATKKWICVTACQKFVKSY